MQYISNSSLAKKGWRLLKNSNRVFRSVRRRLGILQRFIDAMLMMMMLHFWPEQVYQFSTRRLLPAKRDRYPPPKVPETPYEVIKSRTSQDLPEFDELNVVLRGSSFDLCQLDTLDNPVVLVSFWPRAMWPKSEVTQDPYGNETWPPIRTNREVIYTHFHSEAVRELLKLNLKVLWIESCYSDEDGNFRPQDGNRDERWYEDLTQHPLVKRISVRQKVEKGGEPVRLRPPTGSGLAAISVCHFLAKTINVYGWDYYLKQTPSDLGYWGLFLKLYSYFIDTYTGKNFIESGIINFYYGHQFSNITGVNVCSYLGQLESHEKLIRKLERVLFSPRRD